MALAYGVASFAASDSATFTWTAQTGSLTSNPPKVIGMSIIPTDGNGPVEANLQGQPTNVGGTVQASAPFTGVVVLLGSD